MRPAAAFTVSGVSRFMAPRWSAAPHSEGHQRGPMGVSGESPGKPAPMRTAVTRRPEAAVRFGCMELSTGVPGALQNVPSDRSFQAALGLATEIVNARAALGRPTRVRYRVVAAGCLLACLC